MVTGLAIDNFTGNGIVINSGSTNNTIESCYIGTNLTGTAAFNGNTGDGILIQGSGNVIGNQCFPNVISGNGGNGVELSGTSATSNTIAGNYIGVDKTGTTALKNAADGVLISGGAVDNYIGDPVNSFGNTISGNGLHGVDIINGNNNEIVDNYIGLGSDGTTTVPNGRSGVRFIQ